MTTKNFIGFNSLEKLLEVCDRTQPVDGMPVTDSGKPDRRFGISIDRHIILVSQAQPNGEVLYCRIITANYQALAGIGALSRGENYSARTESAWKIVKDEIRGRGFELREALVATPKGYQFLDGQAECLRYNKDTDLFEHREVEEPA